MAARIHNFHDMQPGEVREFENGYHEDGSKKSQLQMALHRHAQRHGWGVKTKVIREQGVWRVERLK